MRIERLDPADETAIARMLGLARRVYAADPVWVPESEAPLLRALADAAAALTAPLVCVHDDEVLARAVAILRPGAVDGQGRPVGYIGGFECLPGHPRAGIEVLLAAEQALRAHGAARVQAPRLDNNLMGLQVERFDLPQTVLTAHNPPWYADVVRQAGYRVQQTLRTYVFDRASMVSLPLVRPGFRTRELNRARLEEEVRIFHALQHEIFSGSPGWVPRSLDDDRRLIEDLLPMIDDELVIIAEDRSGQAVGLLVCLPDVYQAYRGERIDRARAISIGVVRPLARKGLGILMGLRLARNLAAKGYRTLEASWVREDNRPPQNMLTRRFRGASGRTFEVYEKIL